MDMAAVNTPFGPFTGTAAPNAWSASLCGMLHRVLSCQGGPERCTVAWWRDLLIGRCEAFGANSHALNQDTDADTAAMFYCCFCVLGLGYFKPNYCLPCVTAPLRTQLRARYQIEDECFGVPAPGCGPVADCCTLAWCAECAECQMTHELYVRGLLKMPADGSWPHCQLKGQDPQQVADTTGLLSGERSPTHSRIQQQESNPVCSAQPPGTVADTA
eukprot:TRINITY_DN49560_c0_g1_i1.p2 TRINITY_DN49560_c0_g1~~TRINITY_DN49560_c0_g1_i1.p2  ORF type:complete len:216 (+),score=52.64 TRINITY_DN49560_c0_g1_i1:14-661(+)